MSIYLKIIGPCLFVLLSLPVHAAPQKPFVAIDDSDGDLILLPSPDANTIKSFPVQSFRDLPVFGSHKPLTSDTYSKQELRMVSLNAARIQSDLMRMKLATTQPNIARLKKNFKSGLGVMPGPEYDSEHPEQAIEDRAWYSLITRLAAASLTDQAYQKYMCKDNPCSSSDLKGKNNGSIGRWGGILANQFESRRAFATFMDTELNTYLAWAKQLNAEPEAYFVGQTKLSSYLFDEGGFAIRLNRQTGGALLTTGENLKDHPVFIGKTIQRQRGVVLVKVNEAEAEKIVERVERKQLFYVYKAKLSIAEQSYNQETKQLDFNRLLFDQTITSDVIEVFIGPELQDKLFDIPL